MGGNSFGSIFRVTTFGESHGAAIGAVIDGCPSGLEITGDDIQVELDRRRPGQSAVTTSRAETDRVEILSGIFEGKTLGTPIALVVRNNDAKSSDYEPLKDIYRPSHADFTYEQKYGIRDWRGGGRSSARETLARVAAGAIAGKFLRINGGIEILSFVEQVGHIKASIDTAAVTPEDIERSVVRCPDIKASSEIVDFIQSVRDEGDSIGGIIRGVIRNVPVGLGEPVFDKLHADLGKAMLSINAAKGFEIGSGFSAVHLRGSELNDEFENSGDTISVRTNNSGGVLGGISSGSDIEFRVVFKPPSTIKREQKTVDRLGNNVEFTGTGRHDPCVLPRAVPIVDAMGRLVLIDHLLRYRIFSKSN